MFDMQKPYYLLSKDEILEEFHTTEQGLTTQEANRRLLINGLNEISKGKKLIGLNFYLNNFKVF
jgi:P-type Ca2+ transporter type 2C